MDIAEAKELAATFRRYRRGTPSVGRKPTLWATVVEREEMVPYGSPPRWKRIIGGDMIFHGGRHGIHCIDVTASTPFRAIAHWEGYAENNGMLKPVAGETVHFFHSSAIGSRLGGVRTGKVLSVGIKNAKIEFKYLNGRTTKTSVPFDEILYTRRIA